ncbi:MAG: 1-(5-phosphoribosyl)-5-((5-phosphoribosylamino)methylideneamino)imidazole-4-carboxamide isomerase [Acidimicrobiales bacterium]
MINFVFMLTHSDSTIENALDHVGELSGTGLRYLGFKDVGATPQRQSEIAKAARDAGFETMLEVVSTTREAEINSVRAALDAGVDWVLGGTQPDSVLPLLEGSSVHYCPFPGRVVGHPSVLEGSIDEIAASAAALTARPGVFGLDLLAYRHASANIEALTRAVVAASSGPVIAAGSVVRDEQIAMLSAAGAWGFTIGSAIFDGLFPGAPDVTAQVRHVLEVAARP